MTKNLFTVYMSWLARELQNIGFKIIRVEPSEKQIGKNVYIFEDTPQFQAALYKCIENRRKK